MELLDGKVEHIIIEVTPEMRKRVQELNQAAINDMKKSNDILKQTNDMQMASMQAATELGIWGETND